MPRAAVKLNDEKSATPRKRVARRTVARASTATTSRPRSTASKISTASARPVTSRSPVRQFNTSNRKAPTSFPAGNSNNKPYFVIVVIIALVVVGGASAAIGMSGGGAIDVQATLAARSPAATVPATNNEEMAAETPVENLVPRSTLRGLGKGVPANKSVVTEPVPDISTTSATSTLAEIDTPDQEADILVESDENSELENNESNEIITDVTAAGS